MKGHHPVTEERHPAASEEHQSQISNKPPGKTKRLSLDEKVIDSNLTVPHPKAKEIVNPKSMEAFPSIFGASKSREHVNSERAAKTGLQTSITRDHTLTRAKGSAEVFPEGISFSEQRRLYLRKLLPGAENHYLITGYGLHMAIDRSPEIAQEATQSGLRLQHKNATVYLRDFPDLANPLFDELLAKEGPPAQGETRILVNSSQVAEKLRALGGDDLKGVTVTAGRTIAPGLTILNISPENLKYKVMSLIKAIGAMPSSYAASRELAPHVDIPDDPSVSTSKALDTLKKSEALRTLKGDFFSDEPVAQAAAALIEGLKVDGREHDPLVADALRSMHNLAQAMASSMDQPAVLAQCFSFMIEEMHIVLSRVRPYDAEAITRTQKDIFKERCPTLKDFAQGAQLVGSGMDALSSGVLTALAAFGRGGLEEYAQKLSYFELPDLLKKGKLGASDAPVIVAPLNPSVPEGRVDYEEMRKTIDGRLKNLKRIEAGQAELDARQPNPQSVVLVLDATVERSSSNLDEALAPLKDLIESGELCVVVCKSYQKYATLGTGKVMAGGMLLVHNGDQKWDACEEKARALAPDIKGHDEAQLLTHMLATANESEIALIQDSALKANRVGQFIWPTHAESNGPKPVPGLPFFTTNDVIGDFRTGPETKPSLVKLGIETRDSFGFLKTSFLWANGYMRVTVGHENLAYLTEHFFALGHLDRSQEFDEPAFVKQLDALYILSKKDAPARFAELRKALKDSDLQTLSPDKLEEKLIALGKRELASIATSYAQLRGDESADPEQTLGFIRQHRNSIEASYHLAVRLRARSQHDQRALGDFLMNRTLGVSGETLSALATDWLKGLADKPKGIEAGDRAILDAIAALVPPHERITFLKSLEWDKMKAEPKAIVDRLMEGIQAEEQFSLLDDLIGARAKNKASVLFDLLQAKGPLFPMDKGLHENDVGRPETMTGDFSVPLSDARKAIDQLV